EPDRLFQHLNEHAEADSKSLQVSTPDPQFDRWFNVWLKHQLRFVARWGRVIGRGFRDILQDSFGHRLLDPAVARACILEVFSKQFPSGKCIRAWRLPHGLLDLQDYADSPSWMIMALSLYLKETGDFAVLAEPVSFLNAEDPYSPSNASATVLEHVVLAQRYLLAHRGSHGLSKIYYGDWCDTMNGVGRAGRGESVMLSMQVKWGCDLLEELAMQLGDYDLASEMNAASREMASAIEAHAWDGQWYVRAFDDDGIPIGSDTPPPSDRGEGRIFLNAQSWAIISGVASEERKEECLAAAFRHLDTGSGMVLNWPAFTALNPRIGQMSAMSPGFYENGSVYVHGNCFWIQALAMAGRGEQAWAALRAILPDTPNKPNADTEPFAIPNYYIGPDVARRKQRNLYLSGWRTGSAAWLYQVGIEWILGARAEYNGLRIDPHLPKGFAPCLLTRSFRGAAYEITLEGASGDEARVDSILLDGKPLEGTLLPLPRAGSSHKVRVTLVPTKTPSEIDASAELLVR
ncbi:MAG: glucosylgalactose phosphorylase, partial [Verrucomicrobiota bacterium]|nr:glucosylgalactose phosphorylase [Verrucomicrobiota bacterium]